MNFLFQPQYIVFKPAKMRYFELKNTIYCGRWKFAFGFNLCYHTLEQSSTAPQYQPQYRRSSSRVAYRVACTLLSKHRPVKAAHLHSKRTAPLSAGGSSKPAQHSAHTTAQFIASAFQNRRWRTRAKLKRKCTGVPWKLNIEQWGYSSTTASR